MCVWVTRAYWASVQATRRHANCMNNANSLPLTFFKTYTYRDPTKCIGLTFYNHTQIAVSCVGRRSSEAHAGGEIHSCPTLLGSASKDSSAMRSFSSSSAQLLYAG